MKFVICVLHKKYIIYMFYFVFVVCFILVSFVLFWFSLLWFPLFWMSLLWLSLLWLNFVIVVFVVDIFVVAPTPTIRNIVFNPKCPFLAVSKFIKSPLPPPPLKQKMYCLTKMLLIEN